MTRYRRRGPRRRSPSPDGRRGIRADADDGEVSGIDSGDVTAVRRRGRMPGHRCIWAESDAQSGAPLEGYRDVGGILPGRHRARQGLDHGRVIGEVDDRQDPRTHREAADGADLDPRAVAVVVDDVALDEEPSRIEPCVVRRHRRQGRIGGGRPGQGGRPLGRHERRVRIVVEAVDGRDPPVTIQTHQPVFEEARAGASRRRRSDPGDIAVDGRCGRQLACRAELRRAGKRAGEQLRPRLACRSPNAASWESTSRSRRHRRRRNAAGQ